MFSVFQGVLVLYSVLKGVLVVFIQPLAGLVASTVENLLARVDEQVRRTAHRRRELEPLGLKRASEDVSEKAG